MPGNGIDFRKIENPEEKSFFLHKGDHPPDINMDRTTGCAAWRIILYALVFLFVHLILIHIFPQLFMTVTITMSLTGIKKKDS